MTTNFSQSAKIYTFPARGRFAVPSQHDAAAPAKTAQCQESLKIASESGWYHEEAIQAEQRRKS
jgi:hypothetical protein